MFLLDCNISSWLAYTGGAVQLNVQAPNGCAWKFNSTPSWTGMAARMGSGNETVGISVGANSGAPRTANLVVGSQSFPLIQDSSPNFFATQLYLDLLNRPPDGAGLTYGRERSAPESPRVRR